MNFRIRVVDVPVLVGVRAAHEYKILLVLDRAVQDLPAVLDPLAEESLRVIAGRRNSDQQLVRVCLHGFLEQVVLLRLFEGMNLITDRKITVQRVLRIRVCRQCPNKKRAVRQRRRHGMLVVIVYYFYQPAGLPADLLLSHAVDIVVQKVKRLERLH